MTPRLPLGGIHSLSLIFILGYLTLGISIMLALLVSESRKELWRTRAA